MTKSINTLIKKLNSHLKKMGVVFYRNESWRILGSDSKEDDIVLFRYASFEDKRICITAARTTFEWHIEFLSSIKVESMNCPVVPKKKEVFLPEKCPSCGSMGQTELKECQNCFKFGYNCCIIGCLCFECEERESLDDSFPRKELL